MAKHSKELLDREADARFWAQTGYKVGRKLDPSDPTDRKMMPVWIDIWGKVRREDAAGDLRITYNHPDVERGLADAEIASHVSDSHVDVAAQTPDPEAARAHTAAAARAARAASSAARRAASEQPPTVSPSVADAVADAVARGAGMGGAPSSVASLPPGHPAVSSEAARPILPPDVAAQVTPGVPGAPGPAPASAPMPAPAPMPMPVPPQRPSDHVAIASAMGTPSAAIGVHEDAHARGAGAGQAPPVHGSMHPQTVAQIREMARRFAANSMGGFVGVVYSPDEQWSVPLFGTPAEASSWYDRMTDASGSFRYAAHFDKTNPAAWPGPVRELFGSSRTLGNSARPEVKKKLPFVAIAAGGAVLVGLAAALATRRRRSSGGSGGSSGSGRRSKAPASSSTPTVQIFEVGKR